MHYISYDGCGNRTECLLEPTGQFNKINRVIMSGDCSAHSEKYTHDRRTHLALEKFACPYKSLENDNKPQRIAILITIETGRLHNFFRN